MPAQVEWHAFGGEIDQQGRFTAGKAAGTFAITARQQQINTQALVTVKPAPTVLTKLIIAPDRVKLNTGEKAKFKVTGYDQHGKPMPVSVSWESSGGNIDAHGEFTADKQPGMFLVKARAESSGMQARAMVTVVKTVAYRLVVSPERVELAPGAKVRFQLALYRDGKEEWTWPWDYTFLAESGTFIDGVYTAPQKPGTYRLTIRHAKATAKATAIVKSEPAKPATPLPKTPAVAAIRVTPQQISIGVGQKIALSAVAVDANGKTVAAKLEWQVAGGRIGNDGYFYAGTEAGSYQIQVREPTSGVHQRITVTITPAAVLSEYQIKVTPQQIVLAPGAQQRFQVKLLRNHHEIWTWPWEFEAETSGGQFQDNVYTAPNQPGKYRLTIRHGKASTSLSIEVLRLKLVPEQVTLKAGESKQFIAEEIVNGRRQTTRPLLWKSSGGTVDASGHYRAGNIPGVYRVTAWLKNSKIKASAAVTVQASLAYRIEVLPPSTTVESGGKVHFQVHVYRGNSKIWVFPWEFTKKATRGTFFDNTYIAPPQPGQYTVTFQYQNMSCSAVVTVQASKNEVTRLTIEPDSVTLLPGQAQLFQALGYDNNNRTVPVEVQWQAQGGQITADGMFHAGGNEGSYQVEAKTASGLSARAEVTIRMAIQRLEVQPQYLTLFPGEKHQFQAKGYLPDGKAVAVNVNWSASGGTIDTNGTFTADQKSGGFWVRAYHPDSKLEARATVQIKTPGVSRLEIAPQQPGLAPGQKQQFTVKGLDSQGNPVAVAVRWFATGGTITDSGKYTAGNEPGYFDVTAVDNYSGIFARTQVKISQPERKPMIRREYQLQVYPGDRTVLPGENVWLTPTLYHNEQKIPSQPWEFSYQATGGTFDGENRNIWVAPAAPGSYSITIKHAQATTVLTMTVVGEEPAQIARLVIYPEEITLSPNQSCAFKAQAFDRQGNLRDCEIKWSATGGKIDQSGQFMAGTAPGSYQVCIELPTDSRIKSCALVSIKITRIFYDEGFKWGYTLKQEITNREQFWQFLRKDLFYQSAIDIEKFRQGFVLGYGPPGRRLMDREWSSVIYALGEEHGRRLRDEGNRRRRDCRIYAQIHLPFAADRKSRISRWLLERLLAIEWFSHLSNVMEKELPVS